MHYVIDILLIIIFGFYLAAWGKLYQITEVKK